MYIQRELKNTILSVLKPNKVVLLLGARRVGKTFLLKDIEKTFEGKVLFMNAEDTNKQQLLSEKSAAHYKRLLQGIDLLIIDEAQTMPDIGNILKLIVDEISGIKVIATGSSSFDMVNKLGEPLTGRSRQIMLFPIAQNELKLIETLPETLQNLPERIIFGSYPEVIQITDLAEKKVYLQEIIQNYLLKDILMLDGIRNASKMYDLLQLVAFQTGKEVSYNELSNKLGINKITVEKYLDLLTKVFVLIKVKAFSRNLRKEVTKNHKWYFFDNGIRNAIINNFSEIQLRPDIGELWENYWIVERMKYNAAKNTLYNYYFWRTYDQQEIDFIEEKDGQLNTYEIKWQDKKVKIPKVFAEMYPQHSFNIVSRENYLNWIVD